MENFNDTRADGAQSPDGNTPVSVGFGQVVPTTAGLPTEPPPQPIPPPPITPVISPAVAQFSQAAPQQPPIQQPVAQPAQAVTALPKPPRKPVNWKKIGKIAGFVALGLAVIAAGVYATIVTINKKNGTGTTVASQFKTIELPLTDFINQGDSLLIGTRTLTVNGTIQANSAIIISPSKQPSNANRGEIYYDDAANQLAYFNGAQFVPLAGNTGVESFGGQTGQLTIGSGLALNNKQLSNSGVLSLQGQTGNVTLTAGPGVSVDGTTITNTGVRSFGSLVGDIKVGSGLTLSPDGTLQNGGVVSATGGSGISVTDDGNGNITISNTGAGSGTVQSPGGTAGRIAKFTGVQTVADSLLSESGTTVTVGGDLSITGNLVLGNALSVGNGGTGATSLAANGVVLGNGTGALSAVTAAGPGLCLLSTAGAPSFAACPSSSGVTTLNGLSGALSVANATAAGSTITINDASTTQKGIAQFNGTNFSASAGVINTIQNISVAATPTFGALTLTSSQATSPMLLVNNTNSAASGNLIDLQLNGSSKLSLSPAGNMTISGTINGQQISSSANFTGTLAVTGATNLNGGATVSGTLTANTITPTGTLTLGATGQTLTMQGNSATTLNATNGSSTTTLAFQVPTANVTYRLLTAAAGTYDVCTTAGNCVGLGGQVTTSGGTTNKIAKFTSSQGLGDSIITDNGTTVTIGGILAANTITPTAALTVGSTGQALTVQGSTTSISSTIGGISTTVNFATPTGANKTITIPNASGTVAVSASGPLAIDAAGNITCPTCATTTTVVTSLNGLTGALSIAGATGSGSTITIQDASTTQKGIAQFNSTNFSASAGTINTIQNINVAATPTFAALTLTSSQATSPMLLVNNTNTSATGNLIDLQINGASKLALSPAGNMTLSGTVNGQTISNAASLTGTLAVAGATSLNGGATVTGTLTANTITPTAALTVGATNQSLTLQGNSSTTITATSGANTTTLAFQAPTANVNYRLLTAAAGTYDICTTAGNCAGIGGGVTTAGGTTNKLAKFTGGQVIGDSIITDNGTTVTIGGVLAANTITPTAALTVGATTQNLTLQGATTALSATAAGITNTLTFATPSGAGKTITIPNASGTVVVSATGPLAIDAAGNISCSSCTTGTVVSSLNGLTGALSITNATGAGSTITIQDASTSQKGLAQFNSTNFTASAGTINTIQNIATTSDPTFRNLSISTLNVSSGQATAPMALINNTNTGGTGNLLDLQLGGVSKLAVSPAGAMTISGAINGQTISSAANFTGSLAVAGAASLNGGATVTGTLTANTITPTGALTVGSTSQSLTLQGNASTTVTATSGANITALAFQTPTANVTYRLLTAAAGTYDICTTAGNCTGVGGGVTTAGGTTNKIAKFSGSQTIADSIITDNGSTVTIGGVLAVNTITPSSSLVVGATGQNVTLQGAITQITATSTGITNTLTFATPTGSNKTITLPNATGTVAVSASGPIAIDANGNLSCPTCVTSGGGGGGVAAVDSVNGLTGALTIANATGSGTTITINDASTSQKGIAQFNGTNFSVSSGTVNTIQDIAVTAAPSFARLTVTSSQATNPMLLVNNTNTGATGNLLDLQLAGSSKLAVSPAGALTLAGTVNGQTISSSASFTGTLAVAGAANLNGGATVTGTLTANTITPTSSLTVGSTGQTFLVQGNAGSTITATNASSTTAIAFQTPTANVTYRFLTAAAGTYDVCTTAGNCSGVGGGVTTAGGTTGKIAKFTSASGIGDSILSESGSTITVGGTLAVNTITPTAAFTAGATAQNTTIQGAATSITATSAGITNTLTFATPSGAGKTITIPNASGTVAVSASGPLAIDAAGNITCTTCATGTTVSSLNGLTGALSLANATGSGSTVTINDASTSQKGIAQFNGTNFTASAGTINTIQDINTTAAPSFGRLTVTSSQATSPMLLVNNTNGAASGNLLDLQLSGASKFSVTPAGNVTAAGTINGQTISSSANFTGTLAVTGNTTLSGTLSVTSGTASVGTNTQLGTLNLYDGSSNTGGITVAALGQNVTYTLPDPGGATATICLTTGNCTGIGGGITGSGTSGKLAKFTGTGTIGDSIISESAGTASVAGNLSLSVGSTYQINGVQISSANLSNDSNLAKLNASQTFSNNNVFQANVTLGDALADSLTIGATVQGATPLVFEGGTVDANQLSFAIGSLTTDRVVTFGDETGTVCLQSSTNCGFAAVTGGSGYIQNQSAAAQAANFAIQSAASATTATASIKMASAQTGDLLNFQDTSGNVTTRFDPTGYLHIDRGVNNSDTVFTVKVSTDTNSRFTISADGKLGWGSGSGATDNFLTRTVAGVLEASNQFSVLGGLQVGSPGFLGKLTIQGGNTSTVGVVIKAVASQTADQLEILDSSGNVNASFNAAGNQLTLGRVAASGTVTPGKIIMADGTTDNFAVTIQTTTLTANRTLTLPNEAGIVCVQGSTNCGFAANSGSANYIQNTTTQQTANMNIISAAAGSIGARIEGAANMSAQALLVKAGSTPTANAFEVQNSSASQIFAVDAANTRVVVGNGNSCTGRFCSGISVSGAGGGTTTNVYNISSVAVSGASTIIGQNIVVNDTSSAVANTIRPLIIDTTGTTNASASINAIQVKLPASALGTAIQITNGTTDVLTVANNGVTAVKTTADSTTAFTVQGTAATNVLTADTFNNTVRLRTVFANNQSTYDAIWLQGPKNGVTAMIGGNDSVNAYATTDFSGELRFNGSNLAWGDFGYYPTGGGNGNNGQFRFSTTGSTVNTTPNAKVGVGDLYVNGNAGIGTNSPSYQLHVVGTIYGSTSVLTPLVDTATAGVLAIGTTTATGINLNQNTTVASNKTLTVNGNTTIQPGTNAAGALTVKDLSNNVLLTVDTNARSVGVGVTGATAATGSVNVGTSTGAAQTVTVGSTNTASTTTLNGGNGITLITGTSTSGVTTQSTTNSATAFQTLNANSSVIFGVDTTDTNLIANVSSPDFEVNNGGWTAQGTGTTVTRDTTYAYNGSASLKITTGTVANSGARLVLNPVQTAASTNYTVSFFARLAAGDATNFTDIIARYSPNGTATVDCNVNSMNNQVVSSFGWYRFWCTFSSATAPTTSGYLQIKDTAGAAHTFWIDSVQLEQSSGAPSLYGSGTLNMNAVFGSGIAIRGTNDTESAITVSNTSNNTIFNVNAIDNQVNLGIVQAGSNAGTKLTFGDVGSNQISLGESVVDATGTGGTDTDVLDVHGSAGIVFSINYNTPLYVASIDSNGSFTVTDNLQSPTKGYRFRTSGSGLDLEASGSGTSGELWLSGWTGAGFTGTQVNFFRMAAAQHLIMVGSGSGSATPTQFALDYKTDNGNDPTGYTGGMYYNAVDDKFRCYEDGFWRDCIAGARTQYQHINDMIGTTAGPDSGFYSSNGGSFSGSTNAGQTGHPGIAQLSTGTTTNGMGAFGTNDTGQSFRLGNGDYWRYEIVAQLPTLSDATNTYTFRTGMFDGNATDGTDGCFFKYSNGVNSGKWQGNCINNGTASTCDATTTVAAGTWYHLTVVVNSSGSSADFQINGTTKCSVTTNIPTASGRETSSNTTITKSAGTTARTALLDYVELLGQFGTPR